jgi:predicted nucleic acid-binding protein
MTDTVVVDASLALKWVLSEADSSIAITLLQKWNTEKIEVIVPALFTYEATNILYRQVVTGKLTFAEAKKLLTKLFSIGIVLNFVHYKDISMQAMEFAHRYQPHMMNITWRWQNVSNANTGRPTHGYGMLWEANSPGFADSATIRIKCNNDFVGTQRSCSIVLLLLELVIEPPA